jgi:chromosome segregation ATPase
LDGTEAKWRDQVSQLELAKSELGAHIAKLESENSRLRSEKEAGNSRQPNLELERALAALEAENLELLTNSTSVSTPSPTLTARIHRLEEENAELRNEIERYRDSEKRIAEFKAAVQGLETELLEIRCGAQSDRAELEESLEQARMEIQRCEVRQQEYEEEIASLKTAMEKTRSKLRKKTRKLRAIEAANQRQQPAEGGIVVDPDFSGESVGSEMQRQRLESLFEKNRRLENTLGDLVVRHSLQKVDM